MTRDEAEQLLPGDHVRLTHDESSRGIVDGVRPLSVFITWESGRTLQYMTDAMPHIEPIHPNNPT